MKLESQSPPRELWYLLLVIPFVAVSIVPMFNSIEPRLLGVPFFWWYQFLWVPLSAALTAIVYFLSERKGTTGRSK